MCACWVPTRACPADDAAYRRWTDARRGSAHREEGVPRARRGGGAGATSGLSGSSARGRGGRAWSTSSRRTAAGPVTLAGARACRHHPLDGTGDMLVVPSVVAADGDQDALPVVLWEALAMELPVVGTNVAGIPEVVNRRGAASWPGATRVPWPTQSGPGGRPRIRSASTPGAPDGIGSTQSHTRAVRRTATRAHRGKRAARAMTLWPRGRAAPPRAAPGPAAPPLGLERPDADLGGRRRTRGRAREAGPRRSRRWTPHSRSGRGAWKSSVVLNS